MKDTKPDPNNPREILSNLIEQILVLTPDQQRRITDIAFGMYLQKGLEDRKEAS